MNADRKGTGAEMQGAEGAHAFDTRPKLLADRAAVAQVAASIHGKLAAGQAEAVRAMVKGYYPPDLADVMAFLNDAEDRALFDVLDPPEAAEVLDELDAHTQAHLGAAVPPERMGPILDRLQSDEAAQVLGAFPPEAAAAVLGKMNAARAAEARRLLAYPKESAGRLMSLGFVAVPESATAAQALDAFRASREAEPLYDLYVVDGQGALKGLLDLHTLVTGEASRRVSELMRRPLVATPPEADQEQVAREFARYDLLALPVVERGANGKLLGVITADDVIDVIEQEATEDAMRIAGSDAAEMERRSPVQIALLRLPWILATMFIELMAGFVIHVFDATLARVLLLASFMPIISAISGNTGLQSATIIVRGLSGGQIQVNEWRRAVLRQLTMTLLLGAVCGVILGAIGALWYGKWTFGLVVGLGMFAAVNIAGVVGTVVPLTSKRLGFDPAITSGPFETAFQDVVGISIFLGLATFMLQYLA